MTAAAAVMAVAVGVSVLLGWVLDIEVLRSIVPGFVSMKANAAVCFMLAGVSLWSRSRRGLHARIATVAAGAIVIIAGATLVEYATGTSLGLDQVLFHDQASAAQAVIPGRMAINTASCFLLIGLSLLLIGVDRRWSRGVVTWLMAASLGATLLAITGYLFGITRLAPGSVYTTMAVNTAVTMLALAIGVLWARPSDGVAALVTAPDPGGTVARRLLPVAIIAPTAAGWIVTQGVSHHVFDAQFARSILVTSVVVIFCGLILAMSRSLSHGHSRLMHAMLEADTDSMSGLLNRRAIDRRFALLQPGDAVVLLDLDAFKQVNDALGHAAGDEVLRAFAGALTGASRQPADWFGRLGGDEFVVVLSGADELGAVRYLSRLHRRWTASVPITTYSAGYAVHERGTTPRQILARADQALYAAKDGGRDRSQAWIAIRDATDPRTPVASR